MIAHNVKMKATEQERQIVEVVRDHRADTSSDFRLLVQRQDGAWDVTLSIAPHDELNNLARNGCHFQRCLGQHGAALGLNAPLASRKTGFGHLDRQKFRFSALQFLPISLDHSQNTKSQARPR